MRTLLWAMALATAACLALPTRAAPLETDINPLVALAPETPVNSSEREVRPKDTVLEQPLGYASGARLLTDAVFETVRYRYRVLAGSTLHARPFTGNFGNGRFGSIAYCGANEYQGKNWTPDRWKRDFAGACFFDSDEDGALDEWRPLATETRFTTKTDPITPVRYEIDRNVPAPGDLTLKLIYRGRKADPARAFQVKVGSLGPFAVEWEQAPGPEGTTILRHQGAELSVAPGDGKSMRVRVLNAFAEGASFAIVTTPTLVSY